MKIRPTSPSLLFLTKLRASRNAVHRSECTNFNIKLIIFTYCKLTLTDVQLRYCRVQKCKMGALLIKSKYHSLNSKIFVEVITPCPSFKNNRSILLSFVSDIEYRVNSLREVPGCSSIKSEILRDMGHNLISLCTRWAY